MDPEPDFLRVKMKNIEKIVGVNLFGEFYGGSTDQG